MMAQIMYSSIHAQATTGGVDPDGLQYVPLLGWIADGWIATPHLHGTMATGDTEN